MHFIFGVVATLEMLTLIEKNCPSERNCPQEVAILGMLTSLEMAIIIYGWLLTLKMINVFGTEFVLNAALHDLVVANI